MVRVFVHDGNHLHRGGKNLITRYGVHAKFSWFMTVFEKRLMLAMGLETVEQLDELLAKPISEDAALHREPPDEAHDLIEAMYVEADRQREARQRFDALAETGYIN
jgi:hypothetical protein